MSCHCFWMQIMRLCAGLAWLLKKMRSNAFSFSLDLSFRRSSTPCQPAMFWLSYRQTIRKPVTICFGLTHGLRARTDALFRPRWIPVVETAGIGTGTNFAVGRATGRHLPRVLGGQARMTSCPSIGGLSGH